MTREKFLEHEAKKKAKADESKVKT